ncbi:MAG TPA: hypothetical protein VJ875_09865 [Pyrinomonadaceae bacterium]|nr:hypothetical protein [Pyrinomonadaceae bacterium]
MKADSNHELLSNLCSQIERAWVDDRNRLLVYELGQKHPEFCDELYEFFEDLVLGPGGATIEIEEAEDRVDQWLQASSLEILRTAAAKEWAMRVTTGATSSAVSDDNETTVTEEKVAGKNENENFQLFLRRRLHQKLVDLVVSWPNVTTEYLVLISRHTALVPERVKETIARYVEKRWQIPIRESLIYLDAERTVLRAASRKQPFEKDPSDFQELLERAGLSAEQKSFWLKLMQ